MNRKMIFLLRFTISLWIVLVISFLSLLVFNAPNVPSLAPFAGVSIQAPDKSGIRLPNRIFNCTETKDTFECQAKVQNRLLDLNLTKGGDNKYYFTNCNALYGEQVVDCRETGMYYAPIPAKTYEIVGMELSSQQLQAVQQDYWGINALMKLGETNLVWIMMGISIVTGTGSALLAWIYPSNFSKAFTSIICGFIVCRLVHSGLGSVPYDSVIPYGFTSDTWNWVVYGGDIFTGVGTIFVASRLLWSSHTNQVVRTFLYLSSVLGALALAAHFFLYILLSLGYAD